MKSSSLKNIFLFNFKFCTLFGKNWNKPVCIIIIESVKEYQKNIEYRYEIVNIINEICSPNKIENTQAQRLYWIQKTLTIFIFIIFIRIL